MHDKRISISNASVATLNSPSCSNSDDVVVDVDDDDDDMEILHERPFSSSSQGKFL